MKYGSLWIFVFLFSSSESVAQTVISTETTHSAVFEKPFDYCFPQTSVRKTQKLRGTTIRITHHVLINDEDLQAATDIYVAGRFARDPEKLWFYSGMRWWDENEHEFNYGYRGTQINERPLVRVVIEYDPGDDRFYEGGEIWVGYGNRAGYENGIWDIQKAIDSYKDMIDRENYELLWEIQPQLHPLQGKLHINSAHLCLEASKMKTTTIRE